MPTVLLGVLVVAVKESVLLIRFPLRSCETRGQVRYDVGDLFPRTLNAAFS